MGGSQCLPSFPSTTIGSGAVSDDQARWVSTANGSRLRGLDNSPRGARQLATEGARRPHGGGGLKALSVQKPAAHLCDLEPLDQWSKSPESLFLSRNSVMEPLDRLGRVSGEDTSPSTASRASRPHRRRELGDRRLRSSPIRRPPSVAIPSHTRAPDFASPRREPPQLLVSLGTMV